MRETERRIKKYQARLPRIKEKLIATLLVFVVSASTMAVATFSWLTLSIAPEVSGITTTIAANGNLEIALVGADGSQPSSSKVGDSTLGILERNRTWGNLINLAGEEYSLDQIVLRPAVLKAFGLLTKPLEAVEYSADGRIIKKNDDFGYAAWNSDTKQFEQTNDKGVRAIASIFYEDNLSIENPQLANYIKRLDDAEGKVDAARDYFENNLDITAISGLIGDYMNSVLRETYNDEECDDDHVTALRDLMVDVDKNVMDVLGDALVTMFNVYQDHTAQLTDTDGNSVYTPVKYTSDDLDTFCSSAVSQLKKMNEARQKAGKQEITITSLSQFVSDRKQLKSDIIKINNLIDSVESTANGVYTWADIQSVANNMVNIASVKLNGKTMTEWFSNLGVTTAITLFGMLGDGDDKAKENSVTVEQGLLKNLDVVLHSGKGFKVDKIVVEFDREALKTKAEKKGISGDLVERLLGNKNKVAANIRTNAIKEYPKSLTTADFGNKEGPIEGNIIIDSWTAEETYGLALDFWVRTNNPNSYLLLEGDVVTKSTPQTEAVEYVIHNADGSTTREKIENAQIYEAYITRTSEDKYDQDVIKQEVPEERWSEFKDSAPTGNSKTQELFKVNIDGEDVWFLKSNGEKIEFGTVETKLTVQIPVNDSEVKTVEIGTRTESVTYSDEGITPIENVEVIGYSGANRVWEEDQIQDALIGGDPSTSTTQGSGSCYIFYADDESQMNQSLELVAAMSVAFINGDTGELLATAYFDTDNAFKEYGRVIVPMYLDAISNSITIASDGEAKPKELKYITEMNRDQPIQITAILYLDGTKVTNDKVMSATEIEGSLNIQFGSYTDPTAFEDDKLMEQTISITAELENSQTAADEKKAIVQLTVSGSTPMKVTGNFTRIINSTQGTRQESFDFVPQGGGTWVGEFTFKNAGEYVLRTVTVDGIDYVLKQEELPSVTIEGVGLDSVSGTEGLRYVYRTAESYVTERFYISIARGGDDNPYPQSVKGVFIGDNGITITQSFVGTEANWQADVTFERSGTYSLNYVLLDGLPYNLTTSIVREVYTGLYAEVKFKHLGPTFIEEEERTNLAYGGVKYYFVANQEPHDFDVMVEIFDNTGEPMEALGNVKLYYTGIDADLVWNEKDKCYSGESFLIDKPGSYSFSYVVVAGQTIQRATAAPTITAATKDPVKYLGIRDEIATNAIELNASEVATEVTLAFNNASAASVYGLFEKKNGSNTSYYVLLAEADTSDETLHTYTFNIPAIDGYWTLVDVKAKDVFDGTSQTFLTGNDAANWPQTSSASMKIVEDTDSAKVTAAVNDAWYALDDVADDSGSVTDYYYNIPLTDYATLQYKNQIKTTKVIASLNVESNLATVKDANTGATGSYVNNVLTFKGQTLQSYQLNDITLKIYDFEKMPIEAENGIALKLEKTANSTEKYGGYTYTGSSANENIALTLNDAETSNTQIKFSVTLDTAGEYVFGLEFTVDGKVFKSIDGIPGAPTSIIVKSDTPTVYISDITLDGSGAYSVDLIDSGSLSDGWEAEEKDSGCLKDYVYTGFTHEDHIFAADNTKYTSRIENSGKTAYIYFKCSHSDNVSYDAGTRNGVSSGPESGKLEKHKYSYDNGNGVPRATITLTGIGNATNAKLKFEKSGGGDVVMATQYTSNSNGYEATADTDSYEWTADGACSRYIGVMKNNSSTSSDTKTVAGTITSSKLELTCNGKTYSVSVPTITIINEY